MLSTTTRRRSFLAAALALSATIAMTGCESASMTADEFARAMEGTDATFRTYDKEGNVMDDITGTSLHVTRDETFDEYNGESTDKGSVMMVQVGDEVLHHVGSTATVIQDGIEIVVPAQQGITADSDRDAVPFLQKIIEHNENIWTGSAKTVLVRTQDDVPVAVFSGAKVAMFKADVPNATALRVTGTDGKARYAMVYRSNLSIYDTSLLDSDLAGTDGADSTDGEDDGTDSEPVDQEG